MMGISYGGISQLFVAATDPPDLAAIAPLSVIDNAATTLYPGGILNTGLRAAVGAGSATTTRCRRRRTDGEPWALKRIQGGDRDLPRPTRCCTARRSATSPDPAANRYYVPSVANPLNPDHVRAQDPRAGVPRLPVDRRADRRSLPRSGRALHRHADASGSRSPTVPTSTRSIPPPSTRWYDFLELYVAQRAPELSSELAGARAAAVPDRDGDRRGHAPGRSDPERARPMPPRWRRSRPCRRSGSCSTTAPAARPRARRSRRSSSRFRASRCPGRPPSRGIWAQVAACRRLRRGRAASTCSTGLPGLGRSPTSPATPDPVACGARRRPTTGRRIRRGRRCRT